MSDDKITELQRHAAELMARREEVIELMARRDALVAESDRLESEFVRAHKRWEAARAMAIDSARDALDAARGIMKDVQNAKEAIA